MNFENVGEWLERKLAEVDDTDVGAGGSTIEELAAEADKYAAENERLREAAVASLRLVFGDMWDAVTPEQREPHIEAALPGLRAAAPLLLAPLQAENEQLRTDLRVEAELYAKAEAALRQRLAEVEKQHLAATVAYKSLVNLIGNDVYAITFQTLGQYRGALYREAAALLPTPPAAPSEETRA